MSLWKRKQKDLDHDFSDADLNPVITYRHLFSQKSSTQDPLRVIALCDSDCFYAACEMVRLELPKEVPLVVLQWESFIAVNYEARKFGISRTFQKQMSKEEAKKRCPGLVIVHVATYKEGEATPGYWDNPDSRTHKVSLDYYRRESVKILQMFKELLPPGAQVEKASIDEAFFDLSTSVRAIMLSKYPHLSTVPEDAPNGLDTPLPPPPDISWGGLGTLVPINPDVDYDASNEKYSTANSWHDVALSIGGELLNHVRQEVNAKLGYSTSAGIARNKFLAKLCASYRKPDGQTILRNNAIPNYLRPMPFQKIRFLGGKLGKAMAEEFEVSTIADMLSVSLEEMQRKFGENAVWVYEVLRGIDRSEVKEKPPANKSMLAAKNLQKPITRVGDGAHWIRLLAGELALRLNEARLDTPTLWPKTLVLHARQGHDSHSKQAPFPFVKAVTIDTIASAGDRLWKELVSGTATSTLKVTSVSLAFTGIETTEVGQRSLDQFLLGSKRTHEEVPDEPGFVCRRCSKHISFPSTSEVEETEEMLAERAKLARMEHDDYHFARDLAREPKGNAAEPATEPVVKKRKKQKESPGSIVHFFARK